MSAPPIIMTVVAILILALFAVFMVTYRNRDTPTEPNYRALAILGAAWLPIGIASDNPGLWGMGLVFLIVGLTNRDKWGQETRWSDLSSQQRTIKILAIGGLTVLLVLGIGYYFVARGGVG